MKEAAIKESKQQAMTPCSNYLSGNDVFHSIHGGSIQSIFKTSASFTGQFVCIKRTRDLSCLPNEVRDKSPDDCAKSCV